MSDGFDPHAIATEAKLTKDFYYFARYAFMKQTGIKWTRNWHHDVICNALMRVFRGECKRLIINMPPRYSKTELAVVNFIAWCLANAPDCEFIHCSYSARLAANNTAKTRDIVTSDWYQRFFPKVKLDSSTSGKDHWRTTAGGVVYAAGSYGTITGFGAGKFLGPDIPYTFKGAMIIDDAHKADEAQSDVMRQNVLDWYAGTAKSRTNSPDTPIIVIMQRLHESDLAGWLLAGGSGEDWEHLVIPAVNDNDEALWPAKHTREDLRKMEAANSYVFAGQYLQLPAPLGGGIFKDSWWRYYRTAPLRFKRIVQSWDTAFKAKETNDPSSCTTWGETDDGYYLLDRFNKRMEFPELKRTAASLYLKWKPNAVLVEDKASGQSLIQEFRQPIDLDGQKVRLPIVAIKVDTDKVTRAFAASPMVESGQVFLPEVADWLPEYTQQLGTFPNAKHDDDVDSTTQALNYFHGTQGKRGLLDYMREQAQTQEQQKEAA